MLRRVFVLGLVVMLVSVLAAVAAIQTSSDEAEAQAAAYQMNYLCLNVYTGIYTGSFAASCPPNNQLITLPDDYPVSLCANTYTGLLSAPQYTGNCPPGTGYRIDLPTETQVNICFNYWTGRLRLATPYPNGSCGSAEFLVAFPIGTSADTYQTLGNIDIDVPASDGVLANDTGPGLMVTAFDAMSTNGGEVNVNPDGSFTYIPPMPDPNAFTGDDSFDYTVESSNGTIEVVTVTIQVLNPVVWFVDVDAVDPGDGRRQTPLNDLQVLNDDGNDRDNPGDVIFLFEAAAPYAGGLVLEDSQTLVGQEVSLAEILAGEFGTASALQGGTPAAVPPHLVLPETDPTPDIPLLTNPTTTLIMVDDTTAAGLTITSETGAAVFVEFAGNALLDTVIATGGNGNPASPGVEVVESELRIVNSEIHGGDGAEAPALTGDSQLQGIPTFGSTGGDGVSSFDSVLDVNGSLIQGGDGAEAVENGGFGGAGIFANNGGLVSSSALQGFDTGVIEITVTDSQIFGGHGGQALGPAEGISQGTTLLGDPPVVTAFGGAGGPGISASTGLGVRRAEAPSLQGVGNEQTDMVVSNSQIRGGNGAIGVDFGGDGGHGIETRGLHTTVDQASTVTGGAGGPATLVVAGTGGAGIRVDSGLFETSSTASDTSLQGPGTGDPGSLSVDSATVTGGQSGTGGASTGAIGGSGIQTGEGTLTDIESSTTLAGTGSDALTITITNATVSGAAGADNPGQAGGLPGGGIIAWDVDMVIEAGSIISGGAGGSGDSGSVGGSGVSVAFSQVMIVDSTVNGGAGGHSDNDVGAAGGVGVDFYNCVICFTMTISGSEVNGGDGGTSNSMAGGAGGVGIQGSNDSLAVTSSTVRGGAPAESGGGRPGFGPGAPAIRMTYEDPGSFTIVLTSNTLVGTAGDPGQAPSLDISVSTGTVCVDATGNIPTGPFELTSNDGLAITQASTSAMSTANSNVTVNTTGTIGVSCTLQPA